MSRKKCCLCDSRVVDGICTKCGMRNGRSDESYHMNERPEENRSLEHSRSDAKNGQKKEQHLKQERVVHRQ